MTRLLARMQTGIVAHGVRAFDGDLDRFVIFTLIARQSMAGTVGYAGAQAVPISMHALAGSLARPYETVRRHVIALTERGLCLRTPDGFIVSPDSVALPPMPALTAATHDHFVRFVEDLDTLGIPLPRQRRDIAYLPQRGVQAAIDLMLAVTHSNRDLYQDWSELTIYSTIVSANTRDYACDPVLATRYADQTSRVPETYHLPVRASVLGRVLGIPESTVRRKIAALIAAGRIVRRREGLVFSQDWLNLPDSVATSTESHGNIRRVLDRVAAAGFPFDDPGSAYLKGSPDPVRFGRTPRTATKSRQVPTERQNG
ncbi:hypothetical protein [Sphingomonas hengshuiensis]|nr:hypothetical protein [Sphingomonas hengshuiensis]